MEISYVYNKPRKEFGRHVAYKRVDAEVLVDIVPNPDDFKDLWVEEPVSEKSVQAGQDFTEHYVNTQRVQLDVHGVNHKQGGWPQGIEPTDAEHTSRYRKKVERDPGYVSAVAAAVGRLDGATQLNNAMNLTEQYFDAADGGTVLSSKPPSLKTISIFRDPASIKRTARRVVWAPESASKAPRKFAAAFCNMTYQYDFNLARAIASSSTLSQTELFREASLSATGVADPSILQQLNLQASSSYIYDVSNSNTPDFELLASNSSSNSALTSLRYSSKDGYIIFAGLYNGQVGFYDVRKSHHIIDTSEITLSHKDPVHDLYVVKSKSGTEFASISTDGRVIWWDTRKLSESLETMELLIGVDGAAARSRPGTQGGGPHAAAEGAQAASAARAEPTQMLIGGTCLNVDPAAGASKFLAGSEAGHVFHCNRKNKPSERVAATLLGHHGPVKCITRSPFFAKYFMTCGDWSVKLWADDIKTPILSTSYSRGTVNGACFSSTRPGIFGAARSDGYLDIYDLFFKVDAPSVSLKVSSAPLTSLEIEPTSQYMAVGGADGTVSLLQASESLYVSSNIVAEKQFIQTLFERESKREKALEQRAKELRIRGGDTAAKGPRDINVLIDPDLVRGIEDEYNNYAF